MAETMDEPIEINRQAVPQRRGRTARIPSTPVSTPKARRVGE
jgi:hypothetical protein